MHDTRSALPTPSCCPRAVSAFVLVPPFRCRLVGGGGWAAWGGGGGLHWSPPLGVIPWGRRCLHSPSRCNAVVRAVHLYPPRTNGHPSKPGTPEVPHTRVRYTGVRGGALVRQARLLPASMDDVSNPQPLTGHERQYTSQAVRCVGPIGHPPGGCATVGRWPMLPRVSRLIACAQTGPIRSPGWGP